MTKDEVSFIGDDYYLDYLTAMNWIRKNKMLSFNIMKIEEGDVILDVGCGTGDDVIILSKMVGKSGKVIGIDIDEKMIAQAKKKSQSISNVEFKIGNIYNLEFEDNYFDGARADRVFQHLIEPDKALSEMIRVVKPNTPIVIMDPDWESLKIDSPNIAGLRGASVFPRATDFDERNLHLGGNFPELNMIAEIPLFIGDHRN